MAKLTGPLRMRGSIEGLNFRMTQNGDCIVGTKPGPSSRMVKEHARFERTRENNREFARTQLAASLLKTSLRQQWVNCADGKCFRRLHRALQQVLLKDRQSKRGDRIITSRALRLLEGFDCNQAAVLTGVLKVPLNCNIDRGAGKMLLTLPSFIPAVRIAPLEDATHVTLTFLGTVVDFDTNKLITVKTASLTIALDEDATAPVVMELDIAMEPAKPAFLWLALTYQRQDALGDLVAMGKKGSNALALLAVDGGGPATG